MFVINMLALLVSIIGAINTGLIGFFNYNLLSVVFGGPVEGAYTAFARVIFAIIGLGGVWVISFFGNPSVFKGCCKPKKDD